MEPFPNHRVDHKVEDPGRQRPALGYSAVGFENCAVEPACPAGHLAQFPERPDEHSGVPVYSPIFQNLEATLSIHYVKRFPEINEDLVQGRLIEERKLLRQLGFRDGGAESPAKSKTVEAVVELEAFQPVVHCHFYNFPDGVLEANAAVSSPRRPSVAG